MYERHSPVRFDAVEVRRRHPPGVNREPDRILGLARGAGRARQNEPVRAHAGAGADPRAGRPVRARGILRLRPPHGRRGVVAAGRVSQARRDGLPRRHGPRDLRRRRPRPDGERPHRPGTRPLEPRRRLELHHPRKPLPQQHLPERQRPIAPQVPPGALRRNPHRGTRAHGARGRFRRPRLHAHHGPPRPRSLPAERHQALHHQRTRRRRAAHLRQDRARARGEGDLRLHRRAGLPRLSRRASGYIWETEINRRCRAIELLEIGAGTTEIRKLIISEELLR